MSDAVVREGDYIDMRGSNIADRFQNMLLVVKEIPRFEGSVDDLVWTNQGYLGMSYAVENRIPFSKGDTVFSSNAGQFVVSNIYWDYAKKDIFVYGLGGNEQVAEPLRLVRPVDDLSTSGSADYGDSDMDNAKFSEGDSVVFTGDDTVYSVSYVYSNRVAYDLYVLGEFGPYSVPERLLERAPVSIEPAQVWVEKVPDTELGTDPGKDRCSIFITRVDGDTVTYAGTWDYYTSTSSVDFIRDHYYLKEEDDG